jgi:hypothetical protein
MGITMHITSTSTSISTIHNTHTIPIVVVVLVVVTNSVPSGMPTKPPAVHMDFLCNEAWLHPSQHHQRHQHPRLINRRSSITSLWVQLDISVILEMVDMLCITTLLSMV